MTIKELRDKSITELQNVLAETRTQLHTARFKVAGRQETKVRRLRAFRREIAQILTVLNEQRHD